ncbi:hypothetical protein F8S13_14100 [Chloroflexia bacterium SDU3-3]|nr:hypothetical protein F8S13_14100 [Chloroflexia bacterium SDU3-3]
MAERHAPEHTATRPGSGLLGHGICLLLIAAAALYVLAANWANTYDDAFITYRYAYNLASGQGFVYNLGERYLGTTAPLYGLLLGGVGALGGAGVIPAASGVISGLALLAASVALYAYACQHRQQICGLFAALFFATCPLLYATFGGEMLFQVALILWAFVANRAGKGYAAAALLALAALTRADGALAGAVVGLHMLATRRRIPWREAALAAAVVAPFALAAWAFYGSPLPATLDAKLAQRSSGLWQPFTTGMVEWVKAYTMQGSSFLFPTMPAAPNAIRFIPLVALGLPALYRYRFWLLPLAWVALFTGSYMLMGVPFYHWYIVPVVVALMVLAASGAALLVDALAWAARRAAGALGRHIPTPQPIIAALVALALAPGIAAQLRDIQRLALQPDAVEEAYEQAGRWVDQHTPAEASVGYFEIGYLGYYAHRRIVDPLGLIDPTLAPHVARRDLTFAYERERPNYIIQNQSIFTEYIGAVASLAWFQSDYREVARIPVQGRPDLIVFQRKT